MKQIILLFALMLMAISAAAQTNTSTTQSGLTYSKKTFYLDGKAISKNQLMNVLGDDLFKKYKKAKGLKTAGIVCTAAGGALLAGGLVGIITAESSDSFSDIFAGGIIGVPCAMIGAAVTIPGIIMWCSGNKKIKKIPIAYNSKNHPTAYLTPASSGMGVALNF